MRITHFFLWNLALIYLHDPFQIGLRCAFNFVKHGTEEVDFRRLHHTHWWQAPQENCQPMICKGSDLIAEQPIGILTLGVFV